MPAISLSTREPRTDIEAQIRAMLSGSAAKDSVFVAAANRRDIPPDLPKRVLRIASPSGILLTTSRGKAWAFKSAPTDYTLALILGYPVHKEEAVRSEQPSVVQARDKGGNVVAEAATSADRLEETKAALAHQAGRGAAVTVHDPMEVQARRLADGGSPAPAAPAFNPSESFSIMGAPTGGATPPNATPEFDASAAFTVVPNAAPKPSYDYSNPWANMVGSPSAGSDIVNLGKGVISGAVGGPGDLESAALAGARRMGWKWGNEPNILPTSSNVEKFLGAGTNPEAQNFEELGTQVGYLAGPGMAKKAIEGVTAIPQAAAAAAEGVGNIARSGAEALSHVTPGATARALGHLSDIGEVTDKSALGERMLNELAPNYARDFADREDAIQAAHREVGIAPESLPRPYLASDAADLSKIGPQTNKSALGRRILSDVRPDYDEMFAQREALLQNAAPARAYANASAEEKNELNAMRRVVYTDPKFADLRQFEETPLGKQITATTGPYSDVPRLDPADLPTKAFRSADSLSNLRKLLSGYGNPQDALESYAQEHAANSLAPIVNGKTAAQAARGARSWALRNNSWLNPEELPNTSKAVSSYIGDLEKAADAQNQEEIAFKNAVSTRKALLEAKQAEINNSPQFSRLRQFENTSLGRQIVGAADGVPGARVVDPADLPARAFRSADSVRNLRQLAATSIANPQDAVESYASEHAANALQDATTGKKIGAAANAAAKWSNDNRAWLKETPLTKAAVDSYVNRLQSVATAQRLGRTGLRVAAYGSGLGALGLLGYGARGLLAHDE